ncbi:hypothetical protein EDB89DRAFT_2246338 [Lactarius sanguifluus]|nr:hypothetical protein EDB89DRAFT_2246338 [Lactarius sanguifluus]
MLSAQRSGAATSLLVVSTQHAPTSTRSQDVINAATPTNKKKKTASAPHGPTIRDASANSELPPPDFDPRPPQLQPPPLGVQRKPTEQHVPQRRCDHDRVMAGKGGEYSADVATEPDCGSGGGMLYLHSAPLRSNDDGGGGL